MAPIVCRAPVCGRVPWTPVALPPSFAACWAWICRGAVAVSVVIAAHSFPTEQHVPVAGSARVAAVAYLSIVPARLIPSRCVPCCVRVRFVRLVQTAPAPASNEHARASLGHHRRSLPANVLIQRVVESSQVRWGTARQAFPSTVSDARRQSVSFGERRWYAGGTTPLTPR